MKGKDEFGERATDRMAMSGGYVVGVCDCGCGCDCGCTSSWTPSGDTCVGRRIEMSLCAVRPDVR